jgi:hypothetical protein
MAIGDDAIAAGMANVNGATTPANTLDAEIMLTRDYLAQGKLGAGVVTNSKIADGSITSQKINPDHKASAASPNTLVQRDASGRAQFVTPSASGDAANKGYVDGAVGGLAGTAGGRAVMDVTGAGNVGLRFGGSRFVGRSGSTEIELANLLDAQAASGAADVANSNANGRVSKSGDTMSGHLWLPAAVAATSGYAIAYINGDGRVSRGASSERFKERIGDVDPLDIGNLFPGFKRWQMRQGDGVWRYGYTAEQLAADADTESFVIYERHIEEDGTAPHLERDADGNPIPLSIDFIGLLLAQVAQLNARVAELEERER